MSSAEVTELNKGRRTARRTTTALVVLLAALELAVRWSGLVDFPVYAKDARFGYAPLANQSGVFLGKNHWAFNNRGMGIAEPWRPSARTDILVIGNSVVLGGNSYDQPDKVVPQIQRRLGLPCAVFPVAVGGWNAVNELRFLESQPDIVDGADFFVWEYMAQGFARAAPWTNDTAFPTSRPVWATAHVLRKIFAERFPATASISAPAEQDPQGNAAAFATLLGRLARREAPATAGIVVLYPDRRELDLARHGHEWLQDRAWIDYLATLHRLRVIDLSREPRWNDTMYRDSVHPTREGNALIGEIIAAEIQVSLGSCG